MTEAAGRIPTQGFQVIMIEHVDFTENWYSNAVVERWSRGLKLMPEVCLREGTEE